MRKAGAVRLERFAPSNLVRRLLVESARVVEAGSASVAASQVAAREVVDARPIELGDELSGRVYWVDRPKFGRGPAVSIAWRDQELLRIDLFEERPHIHYGLAQQRAIDASGAQVHLLPDEHGAGGADRAAFEVERNLAYCIATHPSRRIRRIRIDESTLKRAAAQVREEIIDLAKTHDP